MQQQIWDSAASPAVSVEELSIKQQLSLSSLIAVMSKQVRKKEIIFYFS